MKYDVNISFQQYPAKSQIWPSPTSSMSSVMLVVCEQTRSTANQSVEKVTVVISVFFHAVQQLQVNDPLVCIKHCMSVGFSGTFVHLGPT